MRNFLIMMERFIDLKIALSKAVGGGESMPLQAKVDEQRAHLMQVAEDMDTLIEPVVLWFKRSPND